MAQLFLVGPLRHRILRLVELLFQDGSRSTDTLSFHSNFSSFQQEHSHL